MSVASQFPPVLVLGASPRISLPIARSLHRRGIAVEIASFQPEERDLSSQAIRQFHRLPPRQTDPDAFRAALLALIRERGFDLILPAGDPALAVLADLYGELGTLLKVGCPSPVAVGRVLNKSLTLDAAQLCGIRIPFTRRISTVENLESIAPQLRFPVVIKPEKRGGSASRVFYFHNAPDLASAIATRGWGDMLLQEYCPGVGVGVEILIHNGECIAKFQHRRLKEAPATGGVAVVAIAEEPDPELIRSSMRLLRALEWEGVAMVEFRVDRTTGSCFLMEINGRYWGSVSLPIMAGVDFPLYHWQILHGEKPFVPARYSIGMRWRWTPGVLDRIQSILSRNLETVGTPRSKRRELFGTLADFSPSTHEAVWSWHDPLPFFAEISYAMRGMSGTVFKSLSRRLLPKWVKSHLDIRSRLVPEARGSYSRLRMNDTLHMRNGNHRRVPAGAKTFLFVCYGNLMRSPFAEALLRHAIEEQQIDGVTVRSAGTHAAPGHTAHPWALAVSREFSLPLDQHRAQPVTLELVSGSDVIFAMDFENLAELEILYPAFKSRIFLLSAYAEGRQRNREIPDPYFGDIDATRRCYAVLKSCIDNVVLDLFSERT